MTFDEAQKTIAIELVKDIDHFIGKETHVGDFDEVSKNGGPYLMWALRWGLQGLSGDEEALRRWAWCPFVTRTLAADLLTLRRYAWSFPDSTRLQMVSLLDRAGKASPTYRGGVS